MKEAAAGPCFYRLNRSFRSRKVPNVDEAFFFPPFPLPSPPHSQVPGSRCSPDCRV